MLLPSKVTTYKDSVISKFSIVLKALSSGGKSPSSLYSILRKKFDDIGEFLIVLDCLYALGKVSYDNNTGVLNYVD